MKKWMIYVMVWMMFAFTGCNADPDMILQNDDIVLSDEEAGADEVYCDLSVDENKPVENQSASLKSEEQSENSGSVGSQSGEAVQICVYICGAVKNPGVYEVAQNSRIFQLVEQAGGLTSDASRESVNLAQSVFDGEMVWIPTVEEIQSGKSSALVNQFQNISDAECSSGKININEASAEELTALNGIGASKAAAIVSYREVHGNFQSIDEIMQVDGIGEGTFEKIKDSITV